MRWMLAATLTVAAPGQELPVPGTVSLATGKILVATRKSRDPILSKSVILLIHYGNEGAMGLILNRPGEKGQDYLGGPIALGVRTLLQSSTKPEGAERVIGDVWMVSSRALIPPNAKALTYAGYTGWSTQQIKDEVARGLWSARPGQAAIVFDPNPSTLWTRLSK